MRNISLRIHRYLSYMPSRTRAGERRRQRILRWINRRYYHR